uniref:Phosphotransferase n=1 Tax=Nothobranchius furzeri TaxID=105023 RepID=A0A8C6LFS7_NOTFU
NMAAGSFPCLNLCWVSCMCLTLQVEETLKPFMLSMKKLREISSRFTKEMDNGLDKKKHQKAAVKMLPTFVRAKPDGSERGDFLALDLGGTNFRVLHIRVEDKKILKVDSQICAIPQEIMQGTGHELFDHLAKCLGEFLESQKLKEQKLPLGFTFSFPCEQTEIDKSILIRWTKGFSCSGVEGKDVVQLLKDAIHKRGDYDISSVVMVNDTVATMMSCNQQEHEDPDCEIGMIIGTGTNACYMEDMKNVKRCEETEGQMCINTEWGGFGDKSPLSDPGALDDILTDFDKEVDETSINPGVHIFEKMISGMYLGEIVRLVLVELTNNNLLFEGKVTVRLDTKHTFETKHMSFIEGARVDQEVIDTIQDLLKVRCSEDDARVVSLVCDTISSRSAHLCAAALAAIANRIRLNKAKDNLKTAVGVDGTVYKKHPNFRHKLEDAVAFLAPECDLKFYISEDGSGKGAWVSGVHFCKSLGACACVSMREGVCDCVCV